MMTDTPADEYNNNNDDDDFASSAVTVSLLSSSSNDNANDIRADERIRKRAIDQFPHHRQPNNPPSPADDDNNNHGNNNNSPTKNRSPAICKPLIVLMLAILMVSVSLRGSNVSTSKNKERGVKDISTKKSTNLPSSFEPIPKGETCPGLCEKRNTARHNKYGGDLLDADDVLRLAKSAREKAIEALKSDYGSYFEDIFVKPASGETTDSNAAPSYFGMAGVSNDGPSRNRLKRKFKLKVLSMMQNIRATEGNVAGCNCLAEHMKQEGKINDDKEAPVRPEFYEKYVFANGGHSQAAGHGNKFNETYTAYFSRDVENVFKAIGIQFEGRNYGMGGMKASPYISICSKEIFGIDVDLLSWNYGMTDKQQETAAFYMYRGALTPGRPALVYIDGGRQAKLSGVGLEGEGLAAFQTDLNLGPRKNEIPDSAPDGIRLTDEKLNELPPYVRALKCNGQIEGKPFCNSKKWSCTSNDIKNGKKCLCPNLAKRSSWHMGYKSHALQGHLLSLPFMEILIEGLEELAESVNKDGTSLWEELNAEEDREYEAFKAKPVFNVIDFHRGGYAPIANDAELLHTIFKGDSICRTSLVPSQTRYLGISTNSDKVGGPSEGWLETYDLGIPLRFNGSQYVFEDGNKPIPGIVQQTYKIDSRATSIDFQKECPAVTMPDYKDWFYGPLKDGKAAFVFPNKKEKEYYGYDRSKFKGILGIVPPVFREVRGPGGPRDFAISHFEQNMKTTVNGKKVAKLHIFNSIAILQGEDGSFRWEPSSDNEDYVIEFEPYGEINGMPAADYHLRLYGAFLY